MLNSGQGMYLLVAATSEKRDLYPGKVVVSTRESFTVEFDTPLALPIGFETLAFCSVRGKFFQQGATLTEVRTDSSTPAYVFRRESEPVSAEQRQTYRLSIALSGIQAQIGLQEKCQVVDFSPEGLGAIGSPGFSIGSVQKVSLTHGEFTIDADARVQTIKVMANGKVRYGLLVPRSNIAARGALEKLSASFQRVQLRRLAGAA